MTSVFTCPFCPSSYLDVFTVRGISYYKCPRCGYREKVKSNFQCVGGE